MNKKVVTLKVEGCTAQLTLNRPKGNILDREMVEALSDNIRELSADPQIRAVLFTGSSDHFSFGASIQEHLPDEAAGMLARFHELFRLMIASRLPYLAAVSGYCLGGGLELAAFCHRVFSTRDARFGQPELKLGVFAPVASLLLPPRIGQSAADDLLLSGRTIDAIEAQQIGLVDHLADDPASAALSYAEESWGSHSSSALRFAVAAARMTYNSRFLEQLEEVETLYLEGLMKLEDPQRGLEAFLRKEPVEWRHN